MKGNRFWAAVIGGIALVSLILAVALWPRGGALQAEVLSDGERVLLLSLDEDGEYTVQSPEGGENVITVQSGRLAVTQASCPDHICMEMGWRTSGQIVCLPNRLVIRFLGQTQADAVAG